MLTVDTIIVLYIFMELFEVQWQKAPTLMGMMVRMHQRYRQHIIFFLLLHPTYYFAVWLVFVSDGAWAAIVLLVIKSIDIATKIMLMQQLFEKREISVQMQQVLVAPLHPFLPYIGLLVYPPLVYLSLNQTIF
jgi:predicted small integral membrane protein